MMGLDLGNITFAGDIIHVNFYADVTAIILSLGVLVFCSRGIIRDHFEGKLFRWLLLGTFCLTISNGISFIGGDEVLPRFISMLLQTVNELLINTVVILWLCYSNYRIYKSQDFLKRGFLVRIIPLFLIIALTFLNLFFGFLFNIDSDHVWHIYWGLALCETIRFCYVIACVIQVSSYKKKHREFKFYTVMSFVLPMVAGTIFTSLTPYSVIPLGFAIGLTNVYAGIINENSFLDRDTGYFNSFYLKYLEADIKDNVIPVKSAMIYRLRYPKNAQEFVKCINPLLPKKCVMIRYNPTTVLMLAQVTDRLALRMMKEDVEQAMTNYNNSNSDENIMFRIETLIRNSTESNTEFYHKLMEKMELEY
jgi:hypothetical protein